MGLTEDALCMCDLETITVVVLLAFNFILQRPHAPLASDVMRPGFKLSIPVKKSQTTVSMVKCYSHFLPLSVW